MSSSILTCVLLPLPLLAQESALPTDFAALVPNDAVALVRMRSAEELAGLLERMRQSAEFDEEPVSAALLLSDLFDDLGAIRIDTAAIATDRPVGAAFALDPVDLEPRVTLILPARGRQELSASLEVLDGACAEASSGSYVALSIGLERAPTAGSSRLARGGAQGMLAAHVDLGRLIDDLGPLIESQLDELEMAIGAGAFEDPDSPVDVRPMLEWYLDLAYDLVDSAERLELALDHRDGELAFDLALGVRERSPLAALVRAEPVDYRAALARLDPDAPMHVVTRYDQSAYMDAMWSLYDDMLAALEAEGDLPRELVAGFRSYVEGARELVERAGELTAASIDLAADGARATALYDTQDPAGFMQAWLELMRSPALEDIGLETGEPFAVELAGREAAAMTARFDLRRLMDLVAEDELPDAEELAEMQAFFDALLGPQGLTVAMLPLEARLGLFAGGDAAWRAVAAQRLARGGALPARLERAAAALDGANPGLLMAVELGAGMRSLLTLVSGFGDDPEVAELAALVESMGERGMPARMHWGAKGLVWRAGAAVELEGLLRLTELGAAQTRLEEQRAIAWYDLIEIEDALERYASDHDGALPDSLVALTGPDPSGERYLQELPTDPWGRAYRYRRTEGGYELTSLGADGEPGGAGADADVDVGSDEEERHEDADSPFVYEIF